MALLKLNSYDNSFSSLAHLVWGNEGDRYFIPLKETKLSGSVAGPFAELSLQQTFSFDEQECSETVEAIYHFPLPGDAALEGVTVRFGNERMTTKLMDRKVAKRCYVDAKRRGRQAVMLVRESPNVFALSVAGITPGEKVLVTTSFFVIGEQRGTGFEFRVPLTIAPRYTRRDERGSRTSGRSLASLIDPLHRFSMDLRTPGTGRLRCLSFAADARNGKMSLHDLIPDRDLVLRWEPEGGEDVKSILLDDGRKHFAVVVTPPEIPRELIGREITLMLDRSSSMLGAKWDKAIWTAERFLDSLRPDDRFNLCLFHNETLWLEPHPVLATDDNKRRARELLQSTDSGGTELGMALEQAMDQLILGNDSAKHVLVITDGEVTDEERIIQAVEGKDRSCSVICIGSAPNSWLVREIARVGRGVVIFLTSDPDERDMKTSLDEIMEMFASPLGQWVTVITDQPVMDPLSGEYMSKDGKFGTAEMTMPKGRSVMLMGMFTGKRGGFVDVWVYEEGRRVQLPVEKVRVRSRVLSRLHWTLCMNRIEQLIGSERRTEEVVALLSAMGVPVKLRSETKVYRENRMQEIRGQFRDRLVNLSLKHGVLCSETAFMAMRKEEGGKVTMLAPVPNALPQDWDERFAPLSNPEMLASLMKGKNGRS